MTSLKHTPGPWECYPAGCFINEDGTAKTPPSEFHVDPVGIVLPVRGNTTRAEADARLIAAAPELLEALHALVIAAEASGQPLGEWAGQPFADARAAITKATGSQE